MEPIETQWLHAAWFHDGTETENNLGADDHETSHAIGLYTD